MKEIRFRVAVAAIAVLTLVGCGGRPDGDSAASGDWGGESSDRETPALAVEGLEVSRGSILQMIEASGTVRGVNEATVVSEVEGTIEEKTFELGDAVNAGQVLVEVDATVAALQLEEARQLFESAQIDLRAAERRFENGSASQSELARARSGANGARARLEAAEAVFQDHSIVAPISGLIASRNADLSRGNFINRGDVVARIVNLSVVEMEIAVGERELSYIDEGVPAIVSIPACGQSSIEATVASIAAGTDPRTGSFPVVIRWENACTRLRSGMSASVRIRSQEQNPGIIIPDAAIRRHDGGEFVFVALNGTVTEREITTGLRLGDRVEVVDGLQEGEVIVTSALAALSDGTGVETTVRGKTGDVL